MGNKINRTIPEPLSGINTSTIIAKAFEHAEPRMGSRLVEANIVLTIAGARGHTEFFIDNPTDQDRKHIDQLNNALLKDGIFVRANAESFVTPKGVSTLMVGISNLRGYDRVSKITKIPGITPFEFSTGLDGFYEWNRNCWSALISLQESNKSRFSKENLPHVIAGIHKGYPDVAIYDMMEWDSNERKWTMTETDIPHVSLYKGAEPNFMFSPKHETDSTIQNTVRIWGNVLNDFYNSPWHQSIRLDTQFIHARTENK